MLKKVGKHTYAQGDEQVSDKSDKRHANLTLKGFQLTGFGIFHFKINVNAVAPGLVNTDMMKNTPQKVIDEAIKNTPLNKAAEPVDIANTVLFLASDNSNHITGETIFITGGM